MKIDMKMTRLPGGMVESWYNRSVRSWVTLVKDDEGNQIGEGLYSHTRGGMLFDHAFAVRSLPDGIIPEERPTRNDFTIRVGKAE